MYALSDFQDLSYIRDNLEKLKFFVGALTDLIFTFDNEVTLDSVTHESVENDLSYFIPSDWDLYLSRRFGDGVDNQEIIKVWKNAQACMGRIETLKSEPKDEYQLFGPPLWDRATL